MSKLPFTQKFLLKTYKEDINEMLDVCDWKSHINDYDICSTIAAIANDNGLKVSPSKLLKSYQKKVKSLNLTDEQWKSEYGSWDSGVPKIIAIIYEILENNHK